MTETLKCPICDSTSALSPRQFDGVEFNCHRCGPFSITNSAFATWKEKKPNSRQLANASGWIREHQNITINSNSIEFLLSIETPSVNTRAVRILTTLGKIVSSISEYYKIYAYNFSNFGNIPNKDDALRNQQYWLGISYSVDFDELGYLLSDYLDKETGFLTSINQTTSLSVQITPKGHAYLAELKKTQVNSQIGFCAMWFDKKVFPIWTNAIEPAIKDAGYDAKRIDTDHHNNRIDDEIIAMLRRSKFVVADFTGQRGGVYFEAGFALGLGLQVIWTCEKSDLKEVHFDNRQYNFVIWEENKLDEFKVALKNRIEATIGRGNFA